MDLVSLIKEQLPNGCHVMLPQLTTPLTFGAFIRRSDQARCPRIPTRVLSLFCFLQSPVRAQLVHNGWKLFSYSRQNLVHWQTKVCGYLLDLLIAQRCLKLVSSDRQIFAVTKPRRYLRSKTR